MPARARERRRSREPGGQRPTHRSRRRRPAGGAASTRDTRVDILKSAAAAFRRLGYHGATVEQIAAARHMRKGNLYYYFRNKEDILFACHQYSIERLLTLLNGIAGTTLPPDEKVRRLIVAVVHTILDKLHGTALFLDLEALSPAHLKLIIVKRDEFDRGLRHLIEDGVRLAGLRRL
jgi:AcrR family transcriptional regulator